MHPCVCTWTSTWYFPEAAGGGTREAHGFRTWGLPSWPADHGPRCWGRWGHTCHVGSHGHGKHFPPEEGAGPASPSHSATMFPFEINLPFFAEWKHAHSSKGAKVGRAARKRFVDCSPCPSKAFSAHLSSKKEIYFGIQEWRWRARDRWENLCELETKSLVGRGA